MLANRRILSLVIGMVLLAGGCSSMSVSTDYDPSANFANLKTYRWLPADEQRLTGDPRIAGDTLLEARIHSAVDRELAQEGYELVPDDAPPDAPVDFLVGYHMTLDRQIDTRTINEVYHYSPGWSGWSPRGRHYYRGGYYYAPRTYVDVYDQGTLLIDLIDPQTRKLIWRGSAVDRMNFQESPQDKTQQINEAVRRMFQNFPPTSEAGPAPVSSSGPKDE